METILSYTIIYHQFLWVSVREEPHWQGASMQKYKNQRKVSFLNETLPIACSYWSEKLNYIEIPKSKVIGKTVWPGEHKQTHKRPDGRYQIYYLPALVKLRGKEAQS